MQSELYLTAHPTMDLTLPSVLFVNVWMMLLCVPVSIVLILAHVYATLKKAGDHLEQMRLVEGGGWVAVAEAEGY